MYNGIIVVNKDSGMSSHDVVYQLRRMTGQKKIGHMGTLDPQARGVLPVCMGSATRLSDLFLKADKQYRAVLRLGIVTDTQDMTGRVLEENDAIPEEDTLKNVIGSFTGEILQVPPMYSAVKHQGKKLYQLARKGVEIEREPRKIMIREILIEKIEGPLVTMLVTCSKGTYIRTLCADIGEKAGCGGCMESLVRTRSGPFRIEGSMTLSEIEKPICGRDDPSEQAGAKERIRSGLLTSDSFFRALSGYCTVPEDDYLLWNGNPLLIRDMKRMEDGAAFGNSDQDHDGFDPLLIELPDGLDAAGAIRMYDSAGTFWGVYEKAARKGLYKPWKMFPPT